MKGNFGVEEQWHHSGGFLAPLWSTVTCGLTAQEQDQTHLYATTATRLFTIPSNYVSHCFSEAKETKLPSMQEEQNLHAQKTDTIKDINAESTVTHIRPRSVGSLGSEVIRCISGHIHRAYHTENNVIS